MGHDQAAGSEQLPQRRQSTLLLQPLQQLCQSIRLGLGQQPLFHSGRGHIGQHLQGVRTRLKTLQTELKEERDLLGVVVPVAVAVFVVFVLFLGQHVQQFAPDVGRIDLGEVPFFTTTDQFGIFNRGIVLGEEILPGLTGTAGHAAPHVEFVDGLFHRHLHADGLRMLQQQLPVGNGQQGSIDVPGDRLNTRQRRQERRGLGRLGLRSRRPQQLPLGQPGRVLTQ